MFHGLKVSMSKGTNKKNIIRDDDSLSATQTTLTQWRTSLENLQRNLQTNESAWEAVLGSYTGLEVVGASLYAPHDVDAHSCLKDLSNARSRLESPPSGVEPHSNAVQRMENAKTEINDVVSSITNTLSIHAKRIETIRQFKYYDSKTKQMVLSESKRRNPSSTKEVERLTRNQKKTQDISVEISNLTSQIHQNMDQIELDKLAVTDRAFSALILLQRQIFDSNPVRDAVMKADKIGIGKRVVPREEQRPWISERPYQAPVAPPAQQVPATGQTVPMAGQQTPPPMGAPIPGQPVPPPAPQPQHPPPTVPDSQSSSVSPGYQVGQQYATPVYSQGYTTNAMPQNYSVQSYESQPSAPMYENESFRQSGRYSTPSPPPPPTSAAQPVPPPPAPAPAPPAIPGQPAPPVSGVPAPPPPPPAPRAPPAQSAPPAPP